MDKQLEFMEPVTPIESLRNLSFWRSEDSGYHTSYTPGSFDYSGVSNENLEPGARSITRVASVCKNPLSSPLQSISNISYLPKRSVKKLDFAYDFLPVEAEHNCKQRQSKVVRSIFTPEKRTQSTSYNVSLPKRSAKKLHFATNTLPGETEPIYKPRQNKVVRNIFTPDKKVDVIGSLFQKVCCMPAIIKIFSYLSNEDMYNFSLVSPTWLQVCEKVSEAKLKKKEYEQFINNTKENHGNRISGNLEKTPNTVGRNLKELGSSLKDINNIVNSRSLKLSPKRSPPVTPRTRRFKKFTKSASLDSRMQLSCVRCCQPAKVNEECTGEEWVECTNNLCSYEFCRFCQSDRHPGKVCYRYDLSGPSPSKRKLSYCSIGTKRCKKNLRRLL